MRLCHFALALCLLLPFAARAVETPTEHAASRAAQQELDAAPAHANLPHYALPPEVLTRAQDVSATRVKLHLVAVGWSMLQLALLLWLGGAAWMRDRAVAASARLRAAGKPGRAFWRECLVFTFLATLALALLDLPLQAYRHSLSVSWGLSVQSWAGWLADLGKGLLVDLGVGIFLCSLSMYLIRRFPRHWWLALWAVMAPIMVGALYIVPLIIDPLFNHFEPLMKTNPALVQQIEKVVARGNMDIPPDRIFLMKASDKTTTMNAYVTGFGSSKRVVVWDTSLRKGTPEEILFIFGHESGHYVLGHVLRGMALAFFGLLPLLWLAFLLMRWSLRRFGATWHIPAQNDWAALFVLMLMLVLFQTVLEPLTNTISRAQEHAADVYGQEAIHGIVSDPQAAAQGSFQVLGQAGLDEPNTPAWVETWMDNHPSTGRRAAFAAFYNPWASDADPKYFRK